MSEGDVLLSSELAALRRTLPEELRPELDRLVMLVQVAEECVRYEPYALADLLRARRG